MVSKTDRQPLIHPVDIPAALGLLTRLPVPVPMERAAARGAAAAWAYPLAGLVVAVIGAAVASATVWIGLPAAVAAVFVLMVGLLLTGAMHEDGLADSFDGLWGGWDKARRLEIMKDSTIGVYGVSALSLSFLLRWLVLGGVIAGGLHWATLITAAMISRASMTGIMALLPNARGDGLSQSVGQPSIFAAAVAALLSGCVTLYIWGWWGLLIIAVAEAASLCWALIAQVKIGGQTGDILGAAQQIVEMAVLLAILIVINWGGTAAF